MSFESIRSLEIELEAAKSQKDFEYARQICFNIVAWALKEREYDLFEEYELDARRKSKNGLERYGVRATAIDWIIEQGFEDDRESADNNLSGERDMGRWDLMDNYILDRTRQIEVGAFVLNGDCVYAEIYYDGRVSAYIRIN